jgi:hypothetical protein
MSKKSSSLKMPQLFSDTTCRLSRIFWFFKATGLFSEYLQFASCYRSVSRDWDMCANRFHRMVTNEVAQRQAISDSGQVPEKRIAKLCWWVFSRFSCMQLLFSAKVASMQTQGVPIEKRPHIRLKKLQNTDLRKGDYLFK